jgi:hypothetical protein
MEEITESQETAAPAEVIAAGLEAATTAEPGAIIPGDPGATTPATAIGQEMDPGGQVERFAVVAEFAPASANDDSRTIDAVWYAGAKVPRFDWRTGQEYDLILSMKGCRLDRLNNGGPVLDSHNAYGVESQMGVVRRAWAEKATGKATIQFSKRDAVTPIWNDVRAGIIQNLSPGMWIYKKVDTTPKGQERKEFTATDWEPFEISLLPIPGDANTTFMSAAGTRPPAQSSVVETQRASAHIKEKPDMETTTQDAGVEARPNEVVLAAARDEAVKAERLRASAIRAIATGPFQVEESFLAALIDEGVSIDTARERIMTKLDADYRKNPTVPINPAGSFCGQDEVDKRREGMEAALLLRGNPGASRELFDKGREFAGLTLVDMARECLNAVGVKTRGMSRYEIARVALQGRNGAAEYFDGAMTTSDFPNILANVANKTLRQAYDAAPRTFVPFCRQVTALDFKPVNRIQLSDIAALQKTNENGEFVRIYLSDSKESYALTTWGGIVPITRKVVLNDDLQALTRIPAGLGIAAATLESDAVWAVITANANMADGVPLFHATHKNLTATNGLAAVANITAARKAMRKQTAPKGTILNLIPRFLIIPAALEGIAAQLTNPINLAATASSADVPAFVRAMVPIVEPRLDAVASVGDTNWYTAADPSTIDTIEYCYLEGQQGVYIETRQGFEVDGVEIKARLDFAAAAIDHRGLQKNTAA